MREIFAQYDGMNAALDDILADYSAADLTVITEFLRRSTDAGRRAGDALAE